MMKLKSDILSINETNSNYVSEQTDNEYYTHLIER